MQKDIDKYISIGGYEVKKEIGKGSFGSIFLAESREGNQVAVKHESKDNIKQMLQLQFSVMDAMQNEEGFPKVYQYKQQPDNNILTMQLLKSTLQQLLKTYNNKFDIKTAFLIMQQILTRIEKLHLKGYLYRDIKPSNFMIGEKQMNLIYMIDFGLCKKYKNNKDVHIPIKQQKKMVGTPLFCSINTHIGLQQSRRDDLEGLFYMIIYFMKPLPWENIKEQNKQKKYQKIKEVKQMTADEELCKDLPKELLSYIKYVRKLEFEDEPDYKYLKSLIAESIKYAEPVGSNEMQWCRQVKKKVEIKFDLGLKNERKIKVESGNQNLFDRLVSQGEKHPQKKQSNQQADQLS